jgi:hypothetical protein
MNSLCVFNQESGLQITAKSILLFRQALPPIILSFRIVKLSNLSRERILHGIALLSNLENKSKPITE